MTRIKKSRSLKRIHSVKTGSKSKIKKALIRSGQDQGKTKAPRVRKQLSAYEKYLLENPEAKSDAIAESLKAEHNASAKAEKAAQLKKKEDQEDNKVEKAEKSKTLLEQLDDFKLKDIY